MRRLITALCCFALGACGGVPNSFSEPVKGRQAEVYAALSGFHGGLTPQLMNLPAITRSTPKDGLIRYVLPSAEGAGEGTVTFEVEPVSESESLVTVEVEMPTVEADIDSTRRQLSEAKAAGQLRQAVREWAEQRAKGKPTTGKLAAIDNQLGFLLLALSPDKAGQAAKLARRGLIADELAQEYQAWNDGKDAPDQAGDFASEDEPAMPRRDKDDGSWGHEADKREADRHVPPRKTRARGEDAPSADWGA